MSEKEYQQQNRILAMMGAIVFVASLLLIGLDKIGLLRGGALIIGAIVYFAIIIAVVVTATLMAMGRLIAKEN